MGGGRSARHTIRRSNEEEEPNPPAMCGSCCCPLSVCWLLQSSRPKLSCFCCSALTLHTMFYTPLLRALFLRAPCCLLLHSAPRRSSLFSSAFRSFPLCPLSRRCELPSYRRSSSLFSADSMGVARPPTIGGEEAREAPGQRGTQSHPTSERGRRRAAGLLSALASHSCAVCFAQLSYKSLAHCSNHAPARSLDLALAIGHRMLRGATLLRAVCSPDRSAASGGRKKSRADSGFSRSWVRSSMVRALAQHASNRSSILRVSNTINHFCSREGRVVLGVGIVGAQNHCAGGRAREESKWLLSTLRGSHFRCLLRRSSRSFCVPAVAAAAAAAAPPD